MRAPRHWFWRLLGQFIPSVWGLTLALLAFSLIGAELAFASLVGLLVFTADDGPRLALDLHDMLFAGLVGPIAAALLWLAAMLPGRLGFRAVLLLGTAVVLAAGGTSCAVTGWHIDDKGGLVALGLFTYGPALLATGLIALAAFVTVPWRVRADGEAQAEVWLAERVKRSPVPVHDAAAQLGRSTAWVEDVAVSLVADGLLELRPTAGWLVSRDQVADGMQRLLSALRDAPRQSVPELLLACTIPEALGRPWIDELAADPDLPVTVDREADRVLWDASTGVTETTWCPRCGGPEHVVGAGLVRCRGCGWEREP